MFSFLASSSTLMRSPEAYCPSKILCLISLQIISPTLGISTFPPRVKLQISYRIRYLNFNPRWNACQAIFHFKTQRKIVFSTHKPLTKDIGRDGKKSNLLAFGHSPENEVSSGLGRLERTPYTATFPPSQDIFVHPTKNGAAVGGPVPLASPHFPFGITAPARAPTCPESWRRGRNGGRTPTPRVPRSSPGSWARNPRWPDARGPRRSPA